MRAGRILPLVLLLAACGKAGPSGPPPPPPVVVATAQQRPMPVELAAIGAVQPVSAVDVKPQVAGALTAVHFQEGEHVTEGQLLFELDARPFRAALQKAKADLAAARAQAEQAGTEAKRFDQLGNGRLASASEVDAARTAARSWEAAVLAAEAAASRAELDLAYTRITSPLTGRAGELTAHPGDSLKANETPLVTVRQLSPVQVAFSVPATSLGEIRARQADGALATFASDRAHGGRAVQGTLAFIDSAVDAATGTVKLKATFPNVDEALWPGDFVDVMLRLAVEENAIVVPAAAVQRGQQGEYLFVIKPDDTADMRSVDVARRSGDLAVIRKGVAAGERVVVDGQLRVAPGAKVAPREAAPPTRVSEAPEVP
jgi:multidrug efflux system membrane fusion protein